MLFHASSLATTVPIWCVVNTTTYAQVRVISISDLVFSLQDHVRDVRPRQCNLEQPQLSKMNVNINDQLTTKKNRSTKLRPTIQVPSFILLNEVSWSISESILLQHSS